MKRILFVDDDRDMGEMMQVALSFSGYDVVTVTSAEDALQALEREAFAAVVTDITLPGITGLELCKQVRRDRSEIPVLVLSGDALAADDAAACGAADFLLKPVSTESLESSLARSLA